MYLYEYIKYPDTTHIKTEENYEMEYLMELFNSEHDNNVMDVEMQMLWPEWILIHNQISIRFQLFRFISIQEKSLKSPILCLIFICLYLPYPMWNFLVATRDKPNYLEFSTLIYKLSYDISCGTSLLLFIFLLVWSPWPDSMLIIGWFLQDQNSGYPVTRICPM